MKHIISIGINNTDGLEPLGAAVSGAEDFAKWGNSQGYTTSLLIDNESSISLSQIFNEIKKIVDAKTCEKLIVFFSGHGILKSPSQEVWLLSNARSNPNESVNLTESVEYARTTGIPYIVFISDACRILPNELQLTGNGSAIFPICDDTGQDCFIDLLYATRPGSSAAEVSITKSSEKFGLFTQTIVEVLNGNYPELIKQQTGDSLNNYYDVSSLDKNSEYKSFKGGNWFINTINSEGAIKSIVAKKAKEISIALLQNPEIRLQHQNPKPNLSEFNDENAKKLLLAAKNQIKDKISNDKLILKGIKENLKIGLDSKDLKNNSFKLIVNGFDSIPESLNVQKVKSKLLNNSEKIFNATGKGSFETKTGFTIIGARINEVLMNCRYEVEKENNKEHIRIYQEKNTSSALIILKNGQSIPIAILNGYIGTLVFEKNRLLTINYTPSQNNDAKYFFYKRNENRIKFVRAFVAGAANEGFDYSKVFENEFGNDITIDYSDAGSYLRQEKSLDPSLGLYAVYAYMQEGKTKDVRSVYEYMKVEPDNLIFDVVMLANKLEENCNRTASFCPMMSLGWAYKRKFENFVHPLVLEASKSLVPNLWTTFDQNGTEIIRVLFNENEIK